MRVLSLSTRALAAYGSSGVAVTPHARVEQPVAVVVQSPVPPL